MSSIDSAGFVVVGSFARAVDYFLYFTKQWFIAYYPQKYLFLYPFQNDFKSFTLSLAHFALSFSI